jgi:ABC-2 type transport system ATP-binding protein
MPAIEVTGLHKQYRRFRRPPTLAVDALDLEVPDGGVFGFLGPNGSGKTTTIRCLLALVRPTSGRTRVLGAESATELARVIPRIGSIVETPSLFPRFSGRRNLELLARIEGIGRRSVQLALERVGLAARADDKVRSYSLGMRQKLGVAAALLKDPELLILDEPANGLDPAGIKEVRELIRGIGAEGRTVFLSSHILSEVVQTCDRVAILARGRCVASGTVDDVLARGRPRGLIARVDDLSAGLAALRSTGIDASIRNGILAVPVAPEDAASITRVLADRGLYVTELRPDEANLESVFLDLTGEQDGGDGP